MRTKTQIRGSKSKGSQFEMDVCHSLRKVYPDIIRHGKEGYQSELDLESRDIVVECKRLKGISWNQAVKYFNKLKEVAPLTADSTIGYSTKKMPYLIFKSNNQPALVMYESNGIKISTFENEFGVQFEKHPSTRVKK